MLEKLSEVKGVSGQCQFSHSWEEEVTKFALCPSQCWVVPAVGMADQQGPRCICTVVWHAKAHQTPSTGHTILPGSSPEDADEIESEYYQ